MTDNAESDDGDRLRRRLVPVARRGPVVTFWRKQDAPRLRGWSRSRRMTGGDGVEAVAVVERFTLAAATAAAAEALEVRTLPADHREETAQRS